MSKGVSKKPAKKPAKAGASKKNAKAKIKAPTHPPSHIHARLPGGLKLAAQACTIIYAFKRTIFGIFLVYLALNLFFASGVGIIHSNITSLRTEVRDSGKFSQALNDLGSLTTGAGWSSSDAGSALQSFLFIIASLATIWALRQLLAGEHVSVKNAYYQGMAPLVPFILVIVVIIIQLLPMTIGAALLGIVASGAFGSAATVIFACLFLLLTSWSLYMLSCSVLALYIVTLPGMQPRQALQSSKKLIQDRRFAVMRRLLFLPLIFILIILAVFLPVLLIYPPLAAPLFFLAAMMSIFFGHTYLYNLYRRLLA